ncbi:hypothetical protein LG293_16825 (plasmid) [Citricoccus nitrophenolicus]
MSEPTAARTYTPVHHTSQEAPVYTPVQVHHTGGLQEYRKAPVEVISSPVVDAAVIAGRARGYADGLATAREQAAVEKMHREAEHQAALARMEAEHRSSLAALQLAAAQLAAVQVKTVEQARTHILQAGVCVAEMVLGSELTDASAAARAAVTRALESPVPSPVHTIRLPQDVARACERVGVAETVSIVADGSLPSGGAVAEYEDGWLDIGIETSLQRITETLLHDEMTTL